MAMNSFSLHQACTGHELIFLFIKCNGVMRSIDLSVMFNDVLIIIYDHKRWQKIEIARLVFSVFL